MYNRLIRIYRRNNQIKLQFPGIDERTVWYFRPNAFIIPLGPAGKIRVIFRFIPRLDLSINYFKGQYWLPRLQLTGPKRKYSIEFIKKWDKDAANRRRSKNHASGIKRMHKRSA